MCLLSPRRLLAGVQGRPRRRRHRRRRNADADGDTDAADADAGDADADADAFDDANADETLVIVTDHAVLMTNLLAANTESVGSEQIGISLLSLISSKMRIPTLSFGFGDPLSEAWRGGAHGNPHFGPFALLGLKRSNAPVRGLQGMIRA